MKQAGIVLTIQLVLLYKAVKTSWLRKPWPGFRSPPPAKEGGAVYMVSNLWFVARHGGLKVMPDFLPGLPDKNRILIDWLSFTITDKSLEDVCQLLGMTVSEFTPARGRYGYHIRLVCGGINIMLDGTPDKNGKPNICIEMSGQGCRDWETFGYPDYFRIFDMACNGEIHLTRLDIAYDDFQGLIPFDIIIEKSIELKEVVTSWRAWDVDQSDKGYSVTYGSRQSNCFARVYDKASERGYNNGEHWIRFETVFREEVALQVAALALNQGVINDTLYWSILSDKIRYVEPSNDSNKSRWETSQFWADLTDNSAGIHLSGDLGDVYNLDKKEHHLFQQYGKSMITILLCRGFGEFVDMLLNGNIEINAKYRALCIKNGLSDSRLSISDLYKLKSALDQIRQEEFEYINPKLGGVKYESHD